MVFTTLQAGLRPSFFLYYNTFPYLISYGFIFRHFMLVSKKLSVMTHLIAFLKIYARFSLDVFLPVYLAHVVFVNLYRKVFHIYMACGKRKEEFFLFLHKYFMPSCLKCFTTNG